MDKTMERIKADAERYTKDEGYQKVYIAGATAENTRFDPLLKMLEQIAESNCDYEDVNFKKLHSTECRACNAK